MQRCGQPLRVPLALKDSTYKMTSVGVAGFQSLYHKLGLGLAFMAVNHPFLDEGCILQRQRQALNFSVPTRGRTVYCKRYSFCLEGSDFASVVHLSW